MLMLRCIRCTVHVNFLFYFFTFILQVPVVPFSIIALSFAGPSHPLSEQSWGIIQTKASICFQSTHRSLGPSKGKQGSRRAQKYWPIHGGCQDWEPNQRGGAEARKESAFLSGEAQRFPSRVSASLEAAKGANPAHRLGKEARTSVPSSGGAENQGGNECPPCRGPGSWLQRMCLSSGPAKKDQKEWPPNKATSPF